MRIEKDDSEFTRRTLIYPFDDGDAGRVYVERRRRRGNLDEWEEVRLNYSMFGNPTVEQARAHAEAILEGCRIAEEMAITDYGPLKREG